MSCPVEATCEKIKFLFEENPFFFHSVPQKETPNGIFRFRNHVELAFARESNQLDSVIRYKKSPVRIKKIVQSFHIIAIKIIKSEFKFILLKFWFIGYFRSHSISNFNWELNLIELFFRHFFH